MKSLLDTSVLLDEEPAPIAGELAISAITLAELHFGVLVARSDVVRAERLRRVALVEATFDALPVDDAVARRYGAVAAAVVGVGRSPRPRVADLLIAATASVHGATLWTRNPDDFAGLEALVDVAVPAARS